MFWKKKEEAPEKLENEAPADAEAATKPCCSGKNKAEDSTQEAAPVEKEHQVPDISTFMFGGNIPSGIKLVGQCVGADPNAIQACVWSPDAQANQHKIRF